MSKYLRYEPPPQKKKELSPIWRGIGCLLLILIPALSYGLMLLFVPLVLNSGMVPYELLSRIHFPAIIYKIPLISSVAIFIGGIDYIWVKLIIFFVILVIMTGLFTFIYTTVYQWIGPPRYTDIDAPPSKHKPKRYVR